MDRVTNQITSCIACANAFEWSQRYIGMLNARVTPNLFDLLYKLFPLDNENLMRLEGIGQDTANTYIIYTPGRIHTHKSMNGVRAALLMLPYRNLNGAFDRKF